MTTRLTGEFTPTEAAVSIALGWLSAAYQGSTGDLQHFAQTPGQEKALKKAIASLHNKLLDKSTLDGLPLDF